MFDVPSISHGLGSLIFAGLAIGLWSHAPSRKASTWIILGCFFTALWCAMATLYVNQLVVGYQWVAVTEVLQDGSWCLALAHRVATSTSAHHSRMMPLIKAGLYIGLTVMLLNAYFIHHQWMPGQYISTFLHIDFIGHLLLSILGLSLIEQLMRGVKEERRWGVKYFCLGVGTLFGYDFFLYAHAILFQGIDATFWGVRGAINLWVAPLIAVSSLRNQQWDLDFAPSRPFVYKTTALISCGVYLMVMGGMAIFVRQMGGQWGKALEILFLVGAALLLFSLISSGRVRSAVKVFLAKNIFQLYYDYRQEWIRFSDLLNGTSNEAPLGTRLIMAFAGMVESPEGVLYVREGDKFLLKEQWNMSIKVQKVEGAQFCAQLNQQTDPILIEDLRHAPGFKDGEVHELLRIKRAWLLIPLHQNSRTEGFILLGKPRSSIQINWEIRDLIHAASVQASVFLNEQKNSEALSIAKQFESYHQVSAFMMHDIKNVLSAIQMVIQNKKHQNDPKFVSSMFTTLESVHARLTRMKQQLDKPTLDNVEHYVAIETIFSEVLQHYDGLSKKVILNETAIDETLLIQVDPDAFNNAMKHLIDNAFEASAPSDAVTVHVRWDDALMIEIEDHGEGMSAEFIQNKLFKPFITTKGERGMGIGVFQVKTFLEQMEGDLIVKSEEQKGTTFSMVIPKTRVKLVQKNKAAEETV